MTKDHGILGSLDDLDRVRSFVRYVLRGFHTLAYEVYLGTHTRL